MNKLFILLLLLNGCTHTVSNYALCTQYKPVFVCRSGDGQSIAICDTKKECNKICKELNKE